MEQPWTSELTTMRPVFRLRWFLAVLCIPLWVADVATQTPGMVTQRALQAFDTDDWASLVGLAHPQALARFRNLVLCRARNQERMRLDSTVPSVFRHQRTPFSIIYGVTSVDQLKMLPTAVMLAGYFRARAALTPSFIAGRDGLFAENRIIGTIQDGDSLAYVVFTTSYRPVTDTAVVTTTRLPHVMSLRRSKQGWKVMLDGGIIWPMSDALDTCARPGKSQ